MNTLDQPHTGYTYIQEVKPATKQQLVELGKLMLELGNKDAALAIENVIDLISQRAKELTDQELSTNSGELLQSTKRSPFTHADWLAEKRQEQELRGVL